MGKKGESCGSLAVRLKKGRRGKIPAKKAGFVLS